MSSIHVWDWNCIAAGNNQSVYICYIAHEAEYMTLTVLADARLVLLRFQDWPCYGATELSRLAMMHSMLSTQSKLSTGWTQPVWVMLYMLEPTVLSKA